MDKYSNLETDDLLKMVADVTERHQLKKQEIINMTKLVDKKIEELDGLEQEYVQILIEVNKRSPNVIREKV